MGISYKDTGVDYGKIDPVKVFAQNQATKTAANIKRFGMNELMSSRGESAYVWEEDDCYKALVIEGLGTKNLIADEMRKITGKTYYDQIAQDTVAMIVNDLVVVGADPMVVNAYFGVGDSAWLEDEERYRDLINGWVNACNLAGAVYGGGETPTLKNIINKDVIDLAGSAVGIIKPKTSLVLGDKLSHEDSIVLINSSGIHANGITLARKIAQEVSGGYSTKLDDGSFYGEALLTPTYIYANLVRNLFEAGIDIHYMANITGHGWRKLMRFNSKFSCVIDKIPQPHIVFDFIKTQSKNDLKEMYGNYNMGAGFAIFVPNYDAIKVNNVAKLLGYTATIAGYIEKSETKRVVINPLNIEFGEEDLKIR